jgi:hypothetical protein
MTRIAVFQQSGDAGSMQYRAVSGRNQAMGRTAGEALDALTAQFSSVEGNTLVIVRNMTPDGFFSAAQCQRLEELISRRREALARKASLSTDEESELEQLLDAEIRAATERAVALRRDLAPP